MSDPWVLALDVGTSSARAILFDSRGVGVPGLRHQESCAPNSEEVGQSTFDADQIVDRAAACVDAVLQLAGDEDKRIAAVGVTTFWHSMVGVDRNGAAITPLYTWADTRAADAADVLKRRIDPAAYHARTGCALHPSYFPARLEWLRRSLPEVYSAVDRWISPGEYLFLKLFGHSACSVSMASATGLFHQNAGKWDEETLAALALPEARLPALTDLDQPAQGLVESFADRWPALARIPWTPAVGDGAASNVGSGCATDRRIAINLGTSGAIRVLFSAVSVDISDDLWCYRLDRNRFLFGGAFSDGGEVAVWMRETLRLDGWDRSLAEVEAMEPDSHGLTFLPFLSGERSTGWRPHARATLHGLSTTTTPAHVLRAGMEAVALRFSLVYASLRRQFPDADEIVAAGGGFKQAPFWAQIIADALGAPLRLSDESEATSRGAAAIALRAAGVLRDEADLSSPHSTLIEPDGAAHSVYRDALARQQALYAAVITQ